MLYCIKVRQVKQSNVKIFCPNFKGNMVEDKDVLDWLNCLILLNSYKSQVQFQTSSNMFFLAKISWVEREV